MTPGCVSQTDRGLALTPAATRICGRALPETCSFAAEGRDDGWAPRPATDPRALGSLQRAGQRTRPPRPPHPRPTPGGPTPRTAGAGGSARWRRGTRAVGGPPPLPPGASAGRRRSAVLTLTPVDFARGQRPYSCIYYFYDYRRSLSKCVQKGALFLRGTPPRPQLNRSKLSSQGQAGNRLHFPIYNPV